MRKILAGLHPDESCVVARLLLTCRIASLIKNEQPISTHIVHRDLIEANFMQTAEQPSTNLSPIANVCRSKIDFLVELVEESLLSRTIDTPYDARAHMDVCVCVCVY